jgi:zinc resistance-associated protein
MKKRIIITFTVLALVSMSAFAMAAGKAGRGRNVEPTLTPEKQVAVEKIVDKHHAKLIELREQIWAKHTELQALSRSGKAERSDIQSLISDISKLRTTMNAERDSMRAEIEKETGIKSFGRGYHGGGMGYGAGEGCPGLGAGGDCGQRGGGFGPRGGMMGGGY